MSATEEIAEGIKSATRALLDNGLTAVHLETKHYDVFAAWPEPTKLIFEVSNKPFDVAPSKRD